MRRGFVLFALLPFSLMGQPRSLMPEYNRAWRLLGQGKPDAAILVLKEILTEDPSFYQAYGQVIQAFRQKGDVGSAERFFWELQTGLGKSEPHLIGGEIWVSYASGQPRKAWAAFQKCVNELPRWPGCNVDGLSAQYANLALPVLRRLLAADPTNAAARFSLGEAYMLLSRFSEAARAYQDALLQGAGDASLRPLVFVRLGEATVSSYTDWARGRAYTEKGLQVAIQLGDYEEELDCLGNLMNYSFHLGDAGATERYFDRLMSRAREIDNPNAIATAYNAWGTLHREQGNADVSVEAYQHALDLYETLPPRRETAEILRQLADSEARRGDYQPAVEHLDRAGKIATEFHDSLSEAFILRARGEIDVQLGDYARAIDFHQRARHRFQGLGLFHLAGGDAGDLGIAYERLGDYFRAEESYQEALRSARRFADTAEQERILTHLAELAVRQDHNRTAVRALQESLALSSRTGMTRFRANTLLLLGRVLGRMGNFPEALKNLHTGLDTARSLKTTELEFLGAHGLGEVLLKDGRAAEAAQEFQEALALAERAGIPDGVRLAQEGLGDAAYQEGLLSEAEAHYRASMEAIESMRSRLGSTDFKALFLAGAVSVYERLIAVLAQRGKPREALDVSEKERARVFLDMLAASRVPVGAGLPEGKPLDAGAIEREMARRDQVLVEFALGEKASYVWAVSGLRTRMATLPARSLIERRAERYRTLLAGHSAQVGPEAFALYQMLIAPLASELAPNKVVIVVPDGALHYLPFETLRSAAGRLFGEDFTIAYAPSASVLGQLRVPAPGGARKELLAYGDPDFGTGLPQPGTIEAVVRGIDTSRGLRLTPLPNTRSEIEAIAALYPASSKIYLGRAASKTAVERERLDGYVRIHFATHAFIDETQPERSGIVLSTIDHSDGVLRLKDILALKINADLIVLSACQTGLGKLVRGEGINGLTRAFLFAGTPRVVASLWDVNDVATTDLMKAFYRKMKDGLRPACALQAAKMDMMHSPVVAYHDPYFWAAFVLVGEP